MNIKLIIIGIFIVGIVICFVLIPKKRSTKKLELIYKSNSGIPFKWKCEIEDESIIKLTDSYVIPNKDKRPLSGAPIKIKYVFKGLKEGETSVTFKFVNITNGLISKEEKNIIKVDKDLNISLIQSK